ARSRARARLHASLASRARPGDPLSFAQTTHNEREHAMHFGASMFFTDYSMTSVELAQALEARGFESIWAPEHSHIPTSRRSPFPGGGDLPKQYYDAMDPFVT